MRIFLFLLSVLCGLARAENVEEMVTVKRDGYTISGLAMRQADAQPKHGIALFPGHPGIMRLREQDGAPKFEMGGNFLVRARRHWVDAETLVMALDAPSDHWPTFYQHFRETARYGADVGALVAEAGRRYGVQEWTFVGTSEGSVSAFHAARMNPQLARRVILSSSLFESTRNGPGLSGAKFDALRSELLWVHHADDPCPYTSYRAAQAFAKKSGAPLLTVRGGGDWSGDRCQARTAHGFVGVEVPTVQAMRSWVKTGKVPADIGP